MDIKKTELKCDILIVGGGVGGLSCAIAVKEQLPDADVLIVEKQTAGYAGKACRGGGVLQYFDPRKVKAEAFLAFHAHEVGCYMDDQELMLITGNGIVIRTDVESIGIKKGKITSGVKIQKLEEDDKVAALDTIAIDGEDEESPSQGDLFQQK